MIDRGWSAQTSASLSVRDLLSKETTKPVRGHDCQMDCHANGQRVIFFTRACGIFAGAASRLSLCSGNDGMRLNKKSLLAFAILQWVSYLSIVELIAIHQSKSFDSVVLDLSGSLLVKALNVLALVVGLSLIYFTPGLLWISKEKERKLPVLLIKSAVVSILLYTAAFSLLKLVFGIELSRSWMLWTCLAIIVAWAFLDRRRFEIEVTRDAMRPLLIGIMTILFLIVLFHGKVFDENFTGDGTESFEFSRSLKTTILPYWDLENGRWGFYPRFMFFAYPNLLSILHLGETEASVRLPFFVFLFGIHVLIGALIPRETERSLPSAEAFLMGAALLLFTVTNIFYSTWHPYFADIAEPTHADTAVTFYLLAAILFASRKEPIWLLLCCFFASLSVANGVGLTVFWFSTLFFLEKHKKWIFFLGLSFAMVYLAYLGFVAFYDRFHPMGFQRWSIQGMLRYFSFGDLLEFGRYLPHVKYLLIMTGVLPICIFPFIAKSDRLSVASYLFSIPYILAVFLFGSHNPHYFTSVGLLFLFPFLRAVRSMGKEKADYVKTGFGVAAGMLIISIFPYAYTLNQDARELGRRTCIEASDYKARVELAKSVYELFPFESYGVGHHTLVHYASNGDCGRGRYDYVLAKGEPSSVGFIRVLDTDLWRRSAVEIPDPPGERYNGNYRYLLQEIYERAR